MSPAAGGDAKWLLLAIAAYSYPLAALFGLSDGSVSLAVVPTIIALAIAAIVGTTLSPAAYKISVLAISAAIFAFNGFFWLTSEYGDPQKMLTFNGVLFVFGLMLALSLGAPRLLENLDRALMVLGVIALVLFVTNVNEYDSGRLTYGDSNPIWLGRLFGMSCIAALYALIRGRARPATAIALLLPLFGAMVMTGSRGPVFAFLLSAAVAFIINPIKNKYLLMVVAAFFLTIAALLLELTGAYGGLRGLSFGEADDVSYFIRLNMFGYTSYIITTFPSGIGVGSFSFMNFTYPHNIVLEFLAEWGWVGGGVYITLFLAGALCLYSSGPRAQILLLLLIFDLANACLSGDITSPRLLYGLAIAGVAYVLSGERKRSRQAASALITDGRRWALSHHPAE